MKRKIIVSIGIACGIIAIVLAVFHFFTPKNPFLERSESVITGIQFGHSSNPLYAGESSETKTLQLLVDFDKAIGASKEQYIEFLQERVQGSDCNWYILYLFGRDTCIVYYKGDAHIGYYCKANDTYTTSNLNLTRENPNLYGIVTWNNGTISYEGIN